MHIIGQNCLVRVVTRSSRLSNSRPLIKSLHWLDIKSRKQFKLSLSHNMQKGSYVISLEITGFENLKVRMPAGAPAESRPLLKSLHLLPIKSSIHLNWTFSNIKYYPRTIPHTCISVIYCISRIASRHWDPKLWSYYILNHGQKEITAIQPSWLLHHVCGIICLLTYVKQNQSQSFFRKKGKNTPFNNRPTGTNLIWTSTNRHIMNSFSYYWPPHKIQILAHSALSFNIVERYWLYGCHYIIICLW